MKLPWSKNAPAVVKPGGQTILGFTRELFIALCMALVVIVYVIQAFKIPTESMTDSLLANDFLLGLKFVYGAPVLPLRITDLKFPGVSDPKPGDVVIFKYPGPDSKDYIKRCVAGPGDTVEIRKKKLFLNGKEMPLPAQGKHMFSDILENGDPRDNFAPLRIPRKGDTLRLSNMPIREFYFARIAIHQENRRASMKTDVQLYIDGEYRNQDYSFSHFHRKLRFADINFDFMEWYLVEEFLRQIRAENPESQVEAKPFLHVDGKKIQEYVLKKDCYFMMGDNRDNSKDSRYWGYLNRNFVKAKAFILYFSYEGTFLRTLINPFGRIRWRRIGKLVQ